MPNYRLKPGEEDFAVVDGEFAGRSYRKNEIYDHYPTGYFNKFEKLPEAKKPAKAAKTGGDE